MKHAKAEVLKETPHSVRSIRLSAIYSPTHMDDCQQLLQVFFMTEKWECMTAATQKFVLGADGQPATIQEDIDVAFSLTHPDWDPDSPTN